MIATASLSKYLKKIKIAKDLCGTESLNSGWFMFKGSNHHLTFFCICCEFDKAVCKFISEINMQEHRENIFSCVSLVI